ncbi:MAG: cation:proton antiporter, partial [Hyphomicrobiaceae bacterium]
IAGADVLAITAEALGDDDDDEELEPVGIAIPTTMAMLGIGFACCALLLAGLPPLSGFIAKFLMLTAMFQSTELGTDATTWTLLALLLLSGLTVVFAMMRAGIRVFWVPLESIVPTVRFLEMLPVVGLLALCIAITIQAGPVSRFMQATADSLHAPAPYVKGVGSAPRVERKQRVGPDNSP